jgi:hypothetical protein
MHYTYDGYTLTAKTDTGARRLARKLIAKGLARPACKIEFFRDSDHCHGWFDL